MEFSVAYYPEYFSPREWDRDLSMIREAGIRSVRFGEFAWSRIQPDEGTFDFSVIDAGIEAAAEHGLTVILCTPTACPPIWLCEKCPDVLPVDLWGRRTVFGARQHRCYNSPSYREASAAVVAAMAERYGKDPRVAAWQIDNELAGEQKKCYCSHCERSFQQWLERKYGDIRELNRRWGCHFWSQDYQRFSQVRPPKQFAMDLHIWHNPSLNLDFIRFSSESIVDFCKMQAEILKRYTAAPVTTNTDDFSYGDTLDLYSLYGPLDIGAFDCYTEKEYEFAFYCDFLRAVKDTGRFWVMENGDGGKLLGRLMEVAEERGCGRYSVFKFRPFPWGQEQSRESLIDLYGRPMPGCATVRRHALEPEKRERLCAQVGLYYDFQSSWAYNAKSLMLDCRDGLSYPNYLLHTVYRALYAEGIPADILKDRSSIRNYRAVLAPMHVLYDAEMEKILIDYVKEGGTLICDTELFLKNQDNVFLEHGLPIYRELFAREGGLPLSGGELKGELAVSFGKGKAVISKAGLTAEEWRSLLRRHAQAGGEGGGAQ